MKINIMPLKSILRIPSHRPFEKLFVLLSLVLADAFVVSKIYNSLFSTPEPVEPPLSRIKIILSNSFLETKAVKIPQDLPIQVVAEETAELILSHHRK